MDSTNTTKPKTDPVRMRSLAVQLANVILLLCHAKKYNTADILEQFTNITPKEREALNIFKEL
jgi:antitoxin component of MazEF toxin-antitoxin module